MRTADVVIIGGGVVGCSMAHHLAARGLQVSLCEREALGGGSTARNAGGVRQQFSSEVNVRMQMLSVGMLERFRDEIGAPADFRQIGYLFLLTRQADADDFQRSLQMWRRLGLEAHWLTAEEARERVPILAVDDVIGCTFCPTDGIASPDSVTRGYAASARRLGARLDEGVDVTGIEVVGGSVKAVRTSAGDIATPVVIDCAGPWSRAVGEMAGLTVPVDPYRRHIFVTDAVAGVDRRSPMTVDFGTTLYFHPEGDGVLVGMSDREPSTFSVDVNPRIIESMVETALVRAPALETAEIRTSWAGLYETTPDHQAILGESDEVDGFWCACGFSGHGFMQAPAAGLLLAQALVDGESELDISHLAPGRFRAGALEVERNII